MLIPIAKTFTAASWGSAFKLVQCEQCVKVYVYRVKRRGQGEGTSPLFLDDEGAQNRATQRAACELQKELDSAIDVVPCPACGWIQSDMQALARRQHLPRLKIAGIALLIALLVPSLMLLAAITKPPEEPVSTRMFVEVLVIMLVQFATGVALLLGRSLAAEHYDPNSEDVEGRLQKGRGRAALLDDLKKTKQEG